MTGRHAPKIPFFVFGIIVVLVLTQIAWWIYYQLEQNKTVFQLHQAVLSLRVRQAVQFANKTFETNILVHAAHGADDAQNSAHGIEIPAGFFLSLGDTVYYNAEPHGYVQATVRWDDLAASIAEAYPELTVERLPQTTEATYKHGPARHVRLPMLIRPKTEFMAEIIGEAERKSLMFTSEGIFLSLMVLIGVYVIFTRLRNELAVESRQKNFILSITHELKSPLASVKLYLQTMMKKNVPEAKRQDFLEHSVADIERLERLVDNMLETARWDSGNYVFRKTKVQLGPLIDQTVSGLRSYLEEEKAQLQMHLENDIWVMGDPHALVSIVDNIVNNAAKYALPPKRVDIHLARDNGQAVLRVSDNGRGIAEQDMPFIFDRFYRAGDEMTRKTKGTGLGLFLVRQLVEAHHAKIVVRNETGSGACFELRFPMAED